MYKIGDKVEYLNNVWEVCDWEVDSVEIYNEKMGVNIYVPIDDIKPYRTAHEKLIELGYEHHEYSYGDVYELKESYKYNGLSGRIQTDNQGAINCGDVYIGLELSRILTQYLEELEEKKE